MVGSHRIYSSTGPRSPSSNPDRRWSYPVCPFPVYSCVCSFVSSPRVPSRLYLWTPTCANLKRKSNGTILGSYFSHHSSQVHMSLTLLSQSHSIWGLREEWPGGSKVKGLGLRSGIYTFWGLWLTRKVEGIWSDVGEIGILGSPSEFSVWEWVGVLKLGSTTSRTSGSDP